MKFYYKTKKQEFDENWEKTRAWYRENGMSEEAIQEMHDFDWEQFKASRIYALHTQELDMDDVLEETDKGIEHPLMKNYMDRLSTSYDAYGGHSRFWWIEEISMPKVSEVLRSLPEKYKEFLTLYCIEGYTQLECSVKLNIPQSTLSDFLRILLYKINKL